MGHNETRIGTAGWAGIAAGVILFDMFAEESLSHAFGRGMENHRTRPLVVGALGVTALHLLRVLPHNPIELDPFTFIGNRIKGSAPPAER